jgi:hypothetical protein
MVNGSLTKPLCGRSRMNSVLHRSKEILLWNRAAGRPYSKGRITPRIAGLFS